jgi:PAS domain S-box-containing protein
MIPAPADFDGVFGALPWAACVIDAGGVILAVNRRWRMHGASGGLGPGAGLEGGDYLQACARAGQPCAAALLLRVLRGEMVEAEYEYECTGPEGAAGACGEAGAAPGAARYRLHMRALPEGRALLLHEALDAQRQVEAQLRESDRRLREMIEMSSDWYWESDEEMRISAVTVRRGGHRARHEASLGKRRWERNLEPIGFTWEEHIADHQAHRPYNNLLMRFTDDEGKRYYWSVSGKPVFDAQGRYRGYRGVGTEVTDRHRWRALRDAETQLFEGVLRGVPLAELAATLCRSLEDALHRPGRVTMMELRGDLLHVLAAPSMPDGYASSLAAGVPRREGHGSCGTAAARNAVVYSPDIAHDPIWAPYHGLVAGLGLAGSSWSLPLRGTAGEVIGAFAIYYADHSEPEPRDAEIVRHTAHLAAMALEQVRAQYALAASEARFRGVVELAQDGILVHDAEGVRYANPALLRMLEADSMAQVFARHPITLLDTPLQDHALARRAAVLGGSGSGLEAFIEMHGSTYKGRPIDVEYASIATEWGGRPAVQTQVRDLTARKWTEREILRLNESLEQKVQDRTSELRQAISELEGFSYMVAHDLRAPLRAIDGYATLLPDDAGVPLAEPAQRDLAAIRRSAQHMGELIDGLLRFSQASRTELARGRLPTREAVEAIAAEFDPHGRAQFVIGELPELAGDPLLLRQVLVNLLTNALKYSAGVAQPRIEVSGRREGGMAEISIADNGAGFDGAYADKLFGIFQRLHSGAEFEGLGVGLAIVRRIVERHGGRVRAEGQVGAGARFTFTIPEA